MAISAPRIIALLASVAAFAAIAAPAHADGEVNIYSLRQPFLIEPLLKVFTEKTGIRTNVVFAKDGVVERMKAEKPSHSVTK